MSSYAAPADLVKYGISSAALQGISSTDQQEAIDGASELADGYFRSRYSLPLTAWGKDVRRVVSIIAVYDLLVIRGYSPAAGADINLRARYEDALDWLARVSRQEVQADVTPTQDQAPGYDDPTITTHPTRGF